MLPNTTLNLPADWPERYDRWKARRTGGSTDTILRAVPLPVMIDGRLCALAQDLGVSPEVLFSAIVAAITLKCDQCSLFFLAMDTAKGHWHNGLMLYQRLQQVGAPKIAA